MSENTTVLPEHQPEPAPRRSRGGLIAVIASVVAVVLIAGGGFAAWRFLSGGGPRPAEVLPDSVFALVTVDLDPSGGQKVEAIKTLRKFPSFRERSGLTEDSDPIKRLFEEIQKDGQCKDLDYERDIKSWIGQRAGLGGVVLDGKAAPVAALQVSDAGNAKSGFERFSKCAELEGDEEGFGWTLVDDYIVMSDSTAHAKEVAAAGKKKPLSEDADFQKWTDEAGGAGIMNVYVGPNAVDVASEELGSSLDDIAGDELGGAAGEDEVADALAAYKDFQGLAAVLRFNDGGIELAVAGGGGKAARAPRRSATTSPRCPRTPRCCSRSPSRDGAFDAIEKADPDGAGAEFFSSMVGLDFPDDLKTLLGDSMSISLGGDAPDDLATIDEPGDVSVGALINGDADAIDEVIGKLEASAGVSLADLQVTKQSGDGKVVLASNEDYADQLLGSGKLADDEGFQDAVPNADDAQMIAYVDFDGDWGKAVLDLVRDGGDKDAEEVADNLEALKAFGASVWTDGDTTHGLVRVALK